MVWGSFHFALLLISKTSGEKAKNCVCNKQNAVEPSFSRQLIILLSFLKQYTEVLFTNNLVIREQTPFIAVYSKILTKSIHSMGKIEFLNVRSGIIPTHT